MSNNLPPLLAELSEIAPQICPKLTFVYMPTIYTIGDFTFWFDKNSEELTAQWEEKLIDVTGTPALDWLQGALMRVIEGKGWDFRNQKAQGVYLVQLWKSSGHTVPMADSRSFDSLVEALLTALIQAIKGEQ